MKQIYTKLLTGWLLIQVSLATGQSTDIKLTDVIPPSPRAQAFQKYGEYPVSHTTGIPSIEIPIYEINTGKIAVPVSVKFHPSGFRPNDQDGIIGLGWSLNAGGEISRQIRGLADDVSHGFLDLTGNNRYTTADLGTMTASNAFMYLRGLEQRSIDGEFDIFSYGAGANGGSFLLRQLGTGTTSNIQPFFLSNKKTERLQARLNSSNNRIEYFDYTNDMGQVYRFGKSLKDNTLAYERTDPNPNPYSGNSITSWLLTEIVSEDKTDTVRFTYNPLRMITLNRSSYVTSVIHNVEKNGVINPGYTQNVRSQSSSVSYWTTNIREIAFRNGKLLFNYTTDGKRLTSIELYNANNVKLRAFTFYTSTYGASGTYNSLHYKLDSLEIGSNANIKYRFDYHNTQETNYVDLSQDWWGYYNGGYFPGSMTPFMTLPTGQNIGEGGVNRNANENAKNLMLKQIKYPTGGTTDFIYEVNQYKDNGVLKNAGGLRIYQLINNNGFGNVNIKTYKYGNNEDGAGEVLIKPVPANLIAQSRAFDWPDINNPNSYQKSTVTSLLNFLPGRTNFGASVYYNMVTEYLGTTLENTGKIVYKYNAMPGLPLLPANEALAEYMSSTYFTYPSAPFPIMPADEEEVFPSARYGLINEKLTYKRNGSSYTLIQKDSTSYNILNQQGISDTRVGKYGKHSCQSCPDIEYTVATQNIVFPGNTEPNPPPFVYRSHSFNGGYVVPLKQVLRQYDDNNGMLSNIKEYAYSSTLHTYPTSIAEQTSNGLPKYTSYEHPQDLVGGYFDIPFASVAVDSMIKRNILAPVLSESNGVRDPMVENTLTFTVRKRTDFKIWDGAANIIKPAIQRMAIGIYDQEARLFFNKYDERGNLLEQRKANDIVSAYLWGYNGMFPVAEAVNALHNQIAYTSFEGDKGNWSFDAAPQTDASSVTGYKVYNISNGNISSGNLPQDDYVVTWWSKSSSILVNGSVGTPLATRNGWTLYQRFIAQSSSTVISGTGLIDELRLYPRRASMRTFTYEPLVGMISEGALTGLITYYQYDALGRMVNVKDQNGNILKQIEYQYQQ